MSSRYELRLYDRVLLTFELTGGGLGGYVADISKADESRNLFPFDLELTDDGILRWLNRRIIPKNCGAYAHIS